MPWKPKGPCSTPGCPNKATHRGKCEDCHKAKERTRWASHHGAYDSPWRKISAAYLAAHPLCECGPECCPDGCFRAAIEVHHIDGQGPSGSNDWDNLMSLAKQCHSRTTAKQTRFGRIA